MLRIEVGRYSDAFCVGWNWGVYAANNKRILLSDLGHKSSVMRTVRDFIATTGMTTTGVTTHKDGTVTIILSGTRAFPKNFKHIAK